MFGERMTQEEHPALFHTSGHDDMQRLAILLWAISRLCRQV